MNMIHGSLVVAPPDQHDGHEPSAPAAPAAMGTGADALEVEAAQDEERRAEIADLTRRVVIGAVLTVPVLVAVMADSLFGASWLLPNRWLQLPLITLTAWATVALGGAALTAAFMPGRPRCDASDAPAA